MSGQPSGGYLGAAVDRGTALRGAFSELVAQELSYSVGHLAAILNGCLFAPSILTFWFVNGVLDFSTAVAIGAVATPGGLQVRLLAYLLVLPAFLVARIVVHLAHPGHRAQILAGSCPNARLMSLDWFSMGILATGLPLAIQNFGPWFGTNLVFLLGIFVLPRIAPREVARPLKLVAIASGVLLFLYASYGDAVGAVPTPATVLGPVATVTLADETTRQLFRLINSLTVGPFLVGALAVVMNHLFTRPELADVPFLEYALPRRDPDLVVVMNAAFGTAFYLVVVTVLAGRLILVP